MMAGLKMDINRPFGNGRDDNGNNLVDEPPGLATSQQNSTGASDGDSVPEGIKGISPSGYPDPIRLSLANGLAGTTQRPTHEWHGSLWLDICMS